MSEILEVVKALAVLVMLSLSAAMIGANAPIIRMPIIAGYILAGVLVGPYALNLISIEQLGKLKFVNDFGLAIIAFSAGSELYFPEIRALFRTIISHSSSIALATILIVPLTTEAISPVIPFLKEYSPTCRINVSILVGCLMIERSASSALAIISELRCRGKLTKTLLGITISSDIILLILFAISSTLTNAACSGGGLESSALIGLVVSLLLCAAFGFILGEILIFFLWIPRISSPVRGLFIIPSGYLVFFLADFIARNSYKSIGIRISLEPLLLCVFASTLAGNESKNRRKFANIMHKASPYVFVPFFLLSGANMNLRAMSQGILFAIIIIVARALAVALGTFFCGKYILRQNASEYRYLWMTLIAQGGTLIGLVNELSHQGDWAQPLAAGMVACVLIDLLLGLRLLRVAMIWSGESENNDSEGYTRLQGDSIEAKDTGFVRILGFDSVSLATAAKVCELGFSVEIIPSKVISSEKADEIIRFTKSTLSKVEKSLTESHSSLPITKIFSLSSSNLDEFCIRRGHSKCSSRFSFPHISNPNSKDDASRTYYLIDSDVENVRAHLSTFTKDVDSLVICLRDDSLSLMICQLIYYFRNLDVGPANQSAEYFCPHNMTVIPLIRDPVLIPKFQQAGCLPIYTMSAITELLSRASTSDDGGSVLMAADDVFNISHPFEMNTSTTLTIKEKEGAMRLNGLFDFSTSSPRIRRRVPTFIESGSPTFSTEISEKQTPVDVQYDYFDKLSALGIADTDPTEYVGKNNTPVHFTLNEQSLAEIMGNDSESYFSDGQTNSERPSSVSINFPKTDLKLKNRDRKSSNASGRRSY